MTWTDGWSRLKALWLHNLIPRVDAIEARLPKPKPRKARAKR